MPGRHRRGDQGHRPGHYEVRPGPAGLKAIVWIEAGQPALLMVNIAPERLPLLAEALNDHLQDPRPGRP